MKSLLRFGYSGAGVYEIVRALTDIGDADRSTGRFVLALFDLVGSCAKQKRFFSVYGCRKSGMVLAWLGSRLRGLRWLRPVPEIGRFAPMRSAFMILSALPAR